MRGGVSLRAYLREPVHPGVEVPGGEVVAPLADGAELRFVDDVRQVSPDEAGQVAGQLHQVHVWAHLQTEDGDVAPCL